jgi:hypothetical protein
MQSSAGGIGDEDIDVAVFRFTLGIPGFDDRLVPRVVGLSLGMLLVINHVLGAEPTPDAQVCVRRMQDACMQGTVSKWAQYQLSGEGPRLRRMAPGMPCTPPCAWLHTAAAPNGMH